MEKNLKSMKKMLKDNGVFYTDDKLCKLLSSYITNNPKTVYDPTCGQGNLLKVFDDNVKKYGQELDPDELEKAKAALVNFEGIAGDTLLNDGFKDVKFDAIVGNYPFGIKWTPDLLIDDERFNVAPAMAPKSKADYAFILHMLHHLKDDGICATICFPGVCYRGNSEGKIRRWLIENNYVERVVRIESGYFVDTNIETVILVLKKNKKNTDVIFEDHKIQKERTVTIDEIKENNFCISVSNYVEEEIQKEEIDIDKVNRECMVVAQLRFIKSMEQDLLIATVFNNDIELATKLKDRIAIVELWLKEDTEKIKNY